MIRKMNALVAALGVTAVVAGASVAQAAVTFDPDGAGPLAAVEITGLDWNSGGNTLAVGGNQAVANYVSGSGSTEFYTYYQSTLALATNGANPVSVPGLQGYEITIVAKFKETVTNVSGNNASFEVVADTGNYIEIYASPINADYEAGTGFNDGTLILSGLIVSGGSTFNVNLQAGQVNLADNAAIPSVQAAGGGVTFGYLDIDVVDFDTAYFTGLSSINLNFNGNLNLPFASGLDASFGFLIDHDALTAQGLSTVAAGAGLGAGNYSELGLGDVNGLFGQGGGPSIQFQTNGNSSLIGTPVVVPEPATAAMGLLALAGLAAASRRRRA